MRLSLFQHADIHDTSGDTSSRDDDFATIRRDTKSLSSEDELVDGDVFEYLIFWHKNNPRKDGRIIGGNGKKGNILLFEKFFNSCWIETNFSLYLMTKIVYVFSYSL